MTTLRDLPSVEELLQTKTAAELIAQYGRPLTLTAIRETLDKIRARFLSGADNCFAAHDLILAQTDSLLSAWIKPTLVPGHQRYGRDPAHEPGTCPIERCDHPRHGCRLTWVFQP